MRIYIAGKYSSLEADDRLENVRKAMGVALDLMKLGYQPYVPLLTHFLDEYANEVGKHVTYVRWMELDFAWLVKCDALFAISFSPGVELEMALARAVGIPVYFTLQDVIDKVPLKLPLAA